MLALLKTYYEIIKKCSVYPCKIYILKYSEMHNSNALINLHPNKYSQGLNYCPFVADLNKYVGSWNTLDELSNTVSAAIKTED